VYQALPYTSALVEKLLETLIMLKNDILAFFSTTPKIRQLSIFPNNYQIKDSFSEDLKYFNVPVAKKNLQVIEKDCKFPTMKLWAYYTDTLLAKTSIENKTDKYDFQWNRAFPTDRLLASQSKVKDVLMSAYLQVLEYLHQNNLIDSELLTIFSYRTFPIDLSFWRLKPIQKPNWWFNFIPQFENESRKEKVFIPSEKVLALLSKNQNGRQIMTFSGSNIECDSEYSYPKKGFYLQLIPFGYKIKGEKMPTDTTIAEIVRRIPSFHGNALHEPFHILNSDLNLDVSGYIAEDDLEIYPLVAQISPNVPDFLQWYKHISEFTITLHKALCNLNEMEVTQDGIGFNMNGKKIAQWQYWVDGISDRGDPHIGIPIGQYIEIQSTHLASILKSYNLSLGYVLYQKYSWVERTRDEVKSIERFKVLNMNQVD
jgi:hypothetical protein